MLGVLGAGVAAAEPAPEPAAVAPRERLSWMTHTLILRQTNAGSWDLGVSASAGWRWLANLDLRRHLSDRYAVAARLRFDDDGIRAADLALSMSFARGRILFPANVLARIDLVLDAGGGAVLGDRAATAFAGAALRAQPTGVEWIMLELGVREAWVPAAPPAAIARGVVSTLPDRAWATEVTLRFSVVWPRRFECVAR